MNSINFLFAVRASLPARTIARKTSIAHEETMVMNFEHDIPNTSCKLRVAVETTLPPGPTEASKADVKFAVSYVCEVPNTIPQDGKGNPSYADGAFVNSSREAFG